MQHDGTQISLTDLITCRHQAEHLDLTRCSKAFSQLLGGYVSHFRGRGVDFAEVRSYQPGDDIRSMDWRVTARTGKPHTKLYQEERERPVFFAVDFSHSMFFGTRVAFKSVIAAQLTATLAWASARQGDRVGGLVFAGAQHIDIRPANRQYGVLPLLKALSKQSATPTKPVNAGYFSHALARLRHVVKPGSLIFVISDFIDFDDNAKRHISQLTLHNDVVCLFIYDNLEANAPPPNRYTISNGAELAVMDTHSRAFCQHYQQQFSQCLNTLKQTLNKYGIPLLEIATAQSVEKMLRQSFGQTDKQTTQQRRQRANI